MLAGARGFAPPRRQRIRVKRNRETTTEPLVSKATGGGGGENRKSIALPPPHPPTPAMRARKGNWLHPSGQRQRLGVVRAGGRGEQTSPSKASDTWRHLKSRILQGSHTGNKSPCVSAAGDGMQARGGGGALPMKDTGLLTCFGPMW